MKRTIKTTKAQKVPVEKLLFQLEMVLFQLDGCSLQPSVVPGYRVGKIPWHGLLEPAALRRAPTPLPAASFKVGNDPGSLLQRGISDKPGQFSHMEVFSSALTSLGPKEGEKHSSLAWFGWDLLRRGGNHLSRSCERESVGLKAPGTWRLHIWAVFKP